MTAQSSSIKLIGANSQPVFPCELMAEAHDGYNATPWKRFDMWLRSDSPLHAGWTHWRPLSDTPAPSALPAKGDSANALPESCKASGSSSALPADSPIVPSQQTSIGEFDADPRQKSAAAYLPSPDKSAGGTATPRTDAEPKLERELATEERMRRTMESAHGELLSECVKLRAHLAQVQQSLAEAEHETHRLREKFGRAESSVVEASIHFPNVGDYVASLERQLSVRSQECAQLKQERDAYHRQGEDCWAAINESCLAGAGDDLADEIKRNVDAVAETNRLNLLLAKENVALRARVAKLGAAPPALTEERIKLTEAVARIDTDFEFEGHFNTQLEIDAYTKGFDDAKEKALKAISLARLASPASSPTQQKP